MRFIFINSPCAPVSSHNPQGPVLLALPPPFRTPRTPLCSLRAYTFLSFPRTRRRPSLLERCRTPRRRPTSSGPSLPALLVHPHWLASRVDLAGLTWATPQLGVFLFFHLWSFDRFKCLRWNSGPNSGSFKRVMTVRASHAQTALRPKRTNVHPPYSIRI
jgi:hypothetical protein